MYIRHKETIYSNENFENKDQYIYNLPEILGKAEINLNPTFLLKGVKKEILISGYDQIDYSPMLEIIRMDNKKRRLTITESIQVLIYSYFRALGNLVVSDTRRSKTLRGIDIGTREVESGLKVGSSILALGAIGINASGQIFLEPNFLFKDRLTIVSTIKDLISADESTRDFWTVVLLIGAVYLSRRAYKYNKKTNFVAKIKAWFKNGNTLTHESSR